MSGSELTAPQRLRAFERDTEAYIAERMPEAERLRGRRQVLRHAVKRVTLEGLFLEFGVATGTTINHIASMTSATVHGFDSFEGLPEDWGNRVRAGTFRQAKLPEVAANVRLHVGLFEDTLPGFLAETPGQVAFMHIDCDLYSSTRTILQHCGDRIVPGTVIAFDEYLNYRGWREHEYKAFQEFVAEHRRSYTYIAVAPDKLQAAVVITG